MVDRRRVLFLCTGNSCRSQMAEAWTRLLWGGRIEPFSAGLEPKELDPLAVQVMAQSGVDMTGQVSKGVDDLPIQSFDLVITVCGHAAETCPSLPGWGRSLHAGFDDPPALAQTAATEEEALAHYRRVRDEIRGFVLSLPTVLNQAPDLKPGASARK